MTFQQLIIDWRYLWEEWRWTWPFLTPTRLGTVTFCLAGLHGFPDCSPRISFQKQMFKLEDSDPRTVSTEEKKKLLICLSEKRIPLHVSLIWGDRRFFSHFQSNTTGTRDEEETERGSHSEHLHSQRPGSEIGLKNPRWLPGYSEVRIRQVSASQCGDQTGTHFKEVHGVWSLPWGEQRGAARQGPRERGAELGQVDRWARRVDAQSGSVETGCGTRPLRSGWTRFKAHRLDDVIWRSHEQRTAASAFNRSSWH